MTWASTPLSTIKPSMTTWLKLQEVCPEGIDIYFDNVGGDLTDAVFMHMNEYARIVVCGQITQYNMDDVDTGPRLLGQLISKRARVEGFLVDQFAHKYEQGINRMAGWIRAGQAKVSRAYRRWHRERTGGVPENDARRKYREAVGKSIRTDISSKLYQGAENPFRPSSWPGKG